MNKFVVKDVLDAGRKGWLKLNSYEGYDIYLPYTTQVRILESNEHFQKIKVLEGEWEGSTVSIPYKHMDTRYTIQYIDKFLFKKGLRLMLDLDKKVLLVEGIGAINVAVDKRFLKKGCYEIRLPHVPVTRIPRKYLYESQGGSRFAESWFQIVPKSDLAKDIYIHFGTYSKGCITVLKNQDKSVWTELYLHLLAHRKKLGCIGMLYVS